MCPLGLYRPSWNDSHRTWTSGSTWISPRTDFGSAHPTIPGLGPRGQSARSRAGTSRVGPPRKARCTGPFLSSQVHRPDRPHQGHYGHANFDLRFVFFLAHRASAAFLATARRSSGVSFRILARTLALPQATKSFLVRGRESAALALRWAFATPTTLSSRSGSTKRNGGLHDAPVA